MIVSISKKSLANNVSNSPCFFAHWGAPRLQRLYSSRRRKRQSEKKEPATETQLAFTRTQYVFSLLFTHVILWIKGGREGDSETEWDKENVSEGVSLGEKRRILTMEKLLSQIPFNYSSAFSPKHLKINLKIRSKLITSTPVWEMRMKG